MIAALESGAIEAGMLAEPLATLAERRGVSVRLSDDFLDGRPANRRLLQPRLGQAQPGRR